VVADATHLHAYVPPRWQLDQRRRDAARQPDSTEARLALALAEADAGEHEAALKDFAQAERAAPETLRAQARSQRYELLVRMSERQRAERRWEQAAALLARTAAPEFTADQRLRAWVQLADIWSAAGDLGRSLESWQQVLDDDRLRRSLWPGD